MRPSFTFRPVTPRDHPVFQTYLRELPEAHLAAIDLAREDATDDPRCRRERHALLVDGQPRALGWTFRKATQLGDGAYWMQVTVAAGARGRGYGRMLCDHLLERLAAHAPGSVRAAVGETNAAGLALAARAGFSEEMRTWPMVLELGGAAEAPSPEPPAGIRITTLDRLQHLPDWTRRLYALENALKRDVPYPEPRTEPTYDHWFRTTIEEPGFLAEANVIALAGEEWIGMSDGYRASAETLSISLTGVVRAYRRRGLGRLMKAHNVAYARRGGYARIETWNDSNNVAIVRLNEAEGFVKRPAVITMIKRCR